MSRNVRGLICVCAIAFAMLLALFPFLVEGPTYQRVIEEIIPKKETTIIFAGDMMFDRSIRVAMQEHGDEHVFSCVGTMLDGADLVVANLEGPVTPYRSVSVGSGVNTPENTTFTFPTSTADFLYRHNIRVVNLGNNHIMNFGRDGVEQTKKYLDAAGVKYFGDPDIAEAERALRMDINGIPFSFVNWSDWTPVGNPSDSNGAGKQNSTVEQIGKERAAGRVVVVYTHWGEEYIPPIQRVRDLAHSFVDAGAAIDIGSHPHVIQEVEEYNGKKIYYSLGNFIFDQYFRDDVRKGLVVKVVFDEKGVASTEDTYTWLDRERTTCPFEDRLIES